MGQSLNLYRTILGSVALPGLFLAFLSAGCQESGPPNTTQTTEPAQKKTTAQRGESAPSSHVSSPANPSSPAPVQPPARRPPKRPVDSWVIFRTAADPDADVDCNYQWTGGNRLEVVTQNVTRLTLDLTKLPEGAPRRGPWNLQIDQQGIQITGVRGKVLDMVRSTNGIWSVDREKSPRRD